MATNEILQFAGTDTGTNLLTQAEYLADAQRSIGNQPGVARSKLVNKALRQSSLIAAAVAQFIADNQANNVVDTAAPADIADWIEAAVRSIGTPTAVAGGTADAITADFTPNVALTNGTTVIVRASAANTTTAPTFAPDGLTAKTIVKGNNLALVAGDIAGAGHWLELQYDATLDKWVLQNPAAGILGGLSIASTAEAQAFTDNTKAISPLRLKEALQGANQSLTANGYQRLPGGLIIQWGRLAIGNPPTDYFGAITFPIAFPNQIFQVNTALYSYAGNAFETLVAVTAHSPTGFDFTVQELAAVTQNVDVTYIAIGA
jgi:hypothetical protein